MNRRRASHLALICAAAVGLSGCVAAAIPLVAGGALVRSQTDGDVAPANATLSNAAQSPQFAELTGQEAALATGQIFIGEAPAPDGLGLQGGRETTNLGLVKVTNHALARMETSRAGSTQISANLADPTSLSPQRAPCDGTTPMILIDLDPAGTLFDPERMPEPSPADRAALQSYRSAGGFVAWISGNSALAAGDVRAALKTSGLDAKGKDDLLLLRYPEERKQTRREDLAKSSCLLAIAGDERPDFDELFRYLSNPDAALGLELLIDDGWFLTPAFATPEPVIPDKPASIAANKEAQP